MTASGDTENTRSVPAIQYLLTAYVNENGKFSEKSTNTAIHDVVRVVNGSLEDVLCLLPYREADVFTMLTFDKILRKTDLIMAQLQDRPKIHTASFVVIHEDTLFGVVIKDSVAHVIGPVRHVLSSINEDKTENCLVLGGNSGLSNQPNLTKIFDVAYIPENHVLIVVPLGGYCFVQYAETNDSSGDEDIGLADRNSGLVLLIGTSFLLLDQVNLKWNKYKDFHMKELALTAVGPGKFLFMYGGGCVFEDDYYVIHGCGPRTATFNEAYYYALMHLGKSFGTEPISLN